MEKEAAFCKDHQPTGGTRAHCLVCACIKLSSALSQIDYALGVPNEHECSPYDFDCDEDRVVRRVQTASQQLAACREALEAIASPLLDITHRDLGEWACRNAARTTLARVDAMGKEKQDANPA